MNTLLENVPLEIDTASELNLSLGQLLVRQPETWSGLTSYLKVNSTEWKRRKNALNLRAKSDTTLKNSFKNFVNFDNYTLYTISMDYLKPKYKDQLIVLNLNVDAAGRLSINEIICNLEVNKRLENKMADFVAALPFHTGEQKPDKLTLILNIF
jgi:hypothetical protein